MALFSSAAPVFIVSDSSLVLGSPGFIVRISMKLSVVMTSGFSELLQSSSFNLFMTLLIIFITVNVNPS